eukprot:GHVU01204901.1.p1 GENE.GHVU01204901.1~~GHVU01204901.1.p1  ORF type:complete len:351 (+),score=61.39 GHVU01204901.1:240-1292(+)
MPVRGRNFKQDEDEALAKAWLSVSTDGATNTDQTMQDFYARIKTAFDERMAGKGIADRSWQSLKSRFQLISHDCAKFASCVRRVESLNESGASNLDVYVSAQTLFEKDATTEGAKTAAKFQFQTAFKWLKDSPKWQIHVANEGTGRPTKDTSRKRAAASASSSSRGGAASAYDTDQDTGDEEEGEDNDSRSPARGTGSGVKAAKTAKMQLNLFSRQVKAAEEMAAQGKHRNQTYLMQVQAGYEELYLKQDSHALQIMSLPVPAEEGPMRELILSMQQAEVHKHQLREQQRLERAALAFGAGGITHVAGQPATGTPILADGASASTASTEAPTAAHRSGYTPAEWEAMTLL